MNSTGHAPPRGCVSFLGGPLLALGLWLVAQALLLPHEAETVRLSVIAGAFFAVLGGWLLAARMRSLSARRGSPVPGQAPRPARSGATTGLPRLVDRISPGLGCVVIPISFLLFGAVMLYFYFSGTPSRRGNPLMGLVAGILFGGLGVAGLWALVAGHVASRRTKRSGDPQRLP